MKSTLIFVFALFAISCNGQRDPHWLPDRNSIIHLFEWKWKDIANECERFLQHKGYGGIQISPPNENIIIPNRPWFERYQPVSYKIFTRSGSEDDFVNMTRRCNKVGVRIYADLVINHMSTDSLNPIGITGDRVDPENKQYPAVPYGPGDFHTSCPINNYNNAENVRNCELNGLKDLDQSKEWVRSKLHEYCNHLIDLGVAGFRVDAAKHMLPADLKYILDNVKNLNTTYNFAPGLRPYIYQEVIDLGGEAISAKEYLHIGNVIEFKYSAEIGRVFRGKDKLTYLSNWGEGWGFVNGLDALVFVNDHDNQRAGAGGTNILTYKEAKQLKMATAFMLAHPYGVTQIMSSFEFSNSDQGPPQDEKENLISPTINSDDTCGKGWVCEHRWRQIYNMVGFKNAVFGTSINNWWSNNDQQIAFCRGNKGFIAFTNWGDLKQTLQTCLPSGVYCDIISGNVAKNGKCSGKSIVVDGDGKAYIELLANEEDGVLAIHSKSKLNVKSKP